MAPFCSIFRPVPKRGVEKSRELLSSATVADRAGLKQAVMSTTVYPFSNLSGLPASASESALHRRRFPPRRRYGSIIANSHSNANIRKGCSPSNRWTAFLCITISDRESHVLVASYFLCMDLRSFPKRHKSQPTMVALYASSHNAQPHRMQDAFARSAHDAGHVS